MVKKAKAKKINEQIAGEEKSVVAVNSRENVPSSPLSEAEQLSIKNWEENLRAIRPLVNIVTTKDASGKSSLNIEPYTQRGCEEERRKLMCAGFSQVTGAKNDDLAVNFVVSCCFASGLGGASVDEEKTAKDMNLVLYALNSLKPQDEFEGMLITRLVALHFQIMKFMQRAIGKEQVEALIDVNVNRTTKLSRLYNETLETLMRYRRKGEQKVVVQHVNVTDGGQAIVSGQMIAGGGGIPKN